MQLIKRIEVNYLRSLYSATLEDVGDLNVIFGRNDSGKSNLLRALNLFFNEEVEPDREIDFALDMADERKREAREAKGRQFIWIKMTFRVPDNYRNALGNEIAIKKQWNRGGEVTTTSFPALETPGRQARLTRFLNDIDYTYIPAIKDITVYADLIERMYGAAADTEVLQGATNQFVRAIEGQTTALSRQLATLFGSPARLAPPTEMSRLFRDLDFAHGDDEHSLLRQKGDGIKARHLPELLRFINESEARTKFYLWGFEEPENSLDLSAAESEAQRFTTFACRRDTQVFITSHSPAFYLCSDADEIATRRYFISKQSKQDDVMIPINASSRIDRIEDAELKMEHAGLLHLPFIIRQLKQHRDDIQHKEQEASDLRAELAAIQRPTWFVEGDNDVAMFTDARNRAGYESDISVRPLGGTPQTTDALFAAVLKQGGIRAEASNLFLFDNDKAGRGAFRKLCKGAIGVQPAACMGNTSAWALPHTDDFRSFLRRHTLSADQAFFTAEFLWPGALASQLCLELTANDLDEEIASWRSAIHGDYWQSISQAKYLELQGTAQGSIDWFYARGVPDKYKRQFFTEAVQRGFATDAIDRVAVRACETLVER